MDHVHISGLGSSDEGLETSPYPHSIRLSVIVSRRSLSNEAGRLILSQHRPDLGRPTLPSVAIREHRPYVDKYSA